MGVTIKDVAKVAGVSISTVSKVINGHYSISEETQERVQQVIQELNFYPSASAQNFAKGATRTVVVLTIPSYHQSPKKSPFQPFFTKQTTKNFPPPVTTLSPAYFQSFSQNPNIPAW